MSDSESEVEYVRSLELIEKKAYIYLGEAEAVTVIIHKDFHLTYFHLTQVLVRDYICVAGDEEGSIERVIDGMD